MKYREFKIGDLVQVEMCGRPLGIIHGTMIPRYHHLGKCTVNVLEYPVLISDVEETSKNHMVYWTGGLYYNKWALDARGYEYPINSVREGFNPLIAHIHPSHLTFLASGS